MIAPGLGEALVAGQRVRVLDLSPPIGASYPCSWPGHVPFERRIDVDFTATSSYRTGSVTMDEHTGTHVDAPIHSIPPRSSGRPGVDGTGDRTVADIPLTDLMGPAAVIDVPSVDATNGRSPRVGPDLIRGYERDHGHLRRGHIVLLRTGWDARYLPVPDGRGYIDAPLAGETPGWPAPAAALIDLLIDRGVRCLGVDTPSIGALDDPGPAHVLALRHDIWPIENLARLDALPQRGATFVFLPLALDGSGGPGRAIGLVPLDR